MPTTFYTEEEVDKIRKSGRIYQHMVQDILESQKNQLADIGGEAVRKMGGYTYIPLDLGKFIEQLSIVCKYFDSQKIHNLGNVRFIDAGAGVGDKVYIAKAFGFHADGIDIDDNAIKASKNLFRWITLEKENILEHDYSKDNIVYYYCPFSDTEKEKMFEEMVENKVLIGTVIMANLKLSHKIQKDDRFKSLYGDIIWVKIKK
jgi:hypothetical protein